MRRLLVVLVLCVACSEEPTQEMSYPISDRFDVQLVGTFKDGLAYNNRRGIYLIVDKTTGQSFVGVSGIGISELSARTETDVIINADGTQTHNTRTVEEER